MNLLLQLWGGGFYLTNKIVLSIAEGRPGDTKRALKLVGWLIYILGVPAWVIILLSKQNWIAASIEAGGVPSMCLGLYNVYRGTDAGSRCLDLIARVFTYASLVLGVGYSLYGYGGINTLTQLLEIGVMVGFLLGSYFLANNRSYGWLFFMLMNASMATLMFLQDRPILSIQQLISLCFVVYGFVTAVRAEKKATIY
jgi:hypothetical protein